mmetsp:Transcript_60431/g.174361  ORF Transcript_60431/g.174361 Transcript_60431/m.174361 type:complete len:338 (+) Transcript_60431:118-1131(+)
MARLRGSLTATPSAPFEDSSSSSQSERRPGPSLSRAAAAATVCKAAGRSGTPSATPAWSSCRSCVAGRSVRRASLLSNSSNIFTSTVNFSRLNSAAASPSNSCEQASDKTCATAAGARSPSPDFGASGTFRICSNASARFPRCAAAAPSSARIGGVSAPPGTRAAMATTSSGRRRRTAEAMSTVYAEGSAGRPRSSSSARIASRRSADSSCSNALGSLAMPSTSCGRSAAAARRSSATSAGLDPERRIASTTGARSSCNASSVRFTRCHTQTAERHSPRAACARTAFLASEGGGGAGDVVLTAPPAEAREAAWTPFFCPEGGLPALPKRGRPPMKKT